MDLVSDYGMKHSKPRQAFSEAAKTFLLPNGTKALILINASKNSLAYFQI